MLPYRGKEKGLRGLYVNFFRSIFGPFFFLEAFLIGDNIYEYAPRLKKLLENKMTSKRDKR